MSSVRSATRAAAVVAFPADTELVAGRVGHHAEPVLRVIVHRQLRGTEAFGVLDPLRRIVDVDVEVQPILELLAFRDALQVEHRESGRRLEVDPSPTDVVGGRVAEELCPEASNRAWVDHVDAHLDGADRLHDITVGGVRSAGVRLLGDGERHAVEGAGLFGQGTVVVRLRIEIDDTSR